MLLLVQNETFLSFLPLPLTLKEGRIKKQVLRISKNNKSRGGIFLYNSTINQLFQTLVFIKSSVKTFKPYHCQKLILNNINKIGIFQSSVEPLRWRFSTNYITTENWSVFLKKDPSYASVF